MHEKTGCKHEIWPRWQVEKLMEAEYYQVWLKTHAPPFLSIIGLASSKSDDTATYDPQQCVAQNRSSKWFSRPRGSGEFEFSAWKLRFSAILFTEAQ
jgi:hypothetical protein